MKFIYFLLLLFLTGCKETDLNLDIPYSGDKLALWGKLKAGSPIRFPLAESAPVLVPLDLPDVSVVRTRNVIRSSSVCLFK